MKTLLVAVCAVRAGDRFAWNRFKRNYLAGYRGLPGGKFDEGEFLQEAAVREIKEELGVAVRFERFHGVIDEIAVTPDGTVRCLLFVCSATPTEPVDTAPRETPEGRFEWLKVEETLEAETVPSDFRILHDLILGEQTGYWKCQQTVREGRPQLDFFERLD